MLLRLRVAGVDVRFERSWLLTFLVVTLLTSRSARALMPYEVSPMSALGLGIGVAVGLTLSLLLHEFAHARASIRSGIGVAHIRMHAAGALCQRSEPIQHAEHQFSVAAAGPVASLGLGIATLIAALVLELSGASQPLAAAFGFVAFANVIIAVSNMLPLFPFDGGKVLHAVLWRASGDRQAASDRVRNGGQQFARVVVAFGIIMVGWAGEVLLGLAIAGFGIYLMLLPPGD